jgi:hypothetical protein
VNFPAAFNGNYPIGPLVQKQLLAQEIEENKTQFLRTH